MQPPAYSALHISVTEHVATVTLLDTGSKPSMGAAHFAELPHACAWLDQDDDVRAVVIRGSGDDFSFGLDLVDMHPLLDLARPGAGAGERQAFLRSIAELQAAFSSVATISKPVIAAVDGWCIGAGVDLISSVDVRLATQRARFSVRETRVRTGLRFVAAWNAAFMPSDDLLEARNAFSERRAPSFTGR